MSSEFGNNIKISIFGESHGAAVGVVINGLPGGEAIDLDEHSAFMKRRQGGNNPFSTPRKEEDIPVFLSGVKDGYTTGTPICAVIENNNVRRRDYNLDIPRPGHADYNAYKKYGGFADLSGGGHSSGRLTAPLCIAGGIMVQILRRRGINLCTHIYSIGEIKDTPMDYMNPKSWDSYDLAPDFPVIDQAAKEKMQNEIIAAKAKKDSVGGVVECGISGVPIGVGDPIFDGIENRIASAIFGIGAVKGIEFGIGFEAARLRGSSVNDPFIFKSGEVVTESNNHGGILGGISSGMPIIFRTAFKPTASIAMPQKSVSLSEMKEATLEIKGRHDPCIAVRGTVCVESAAAIAIADMIL